MTHAKRYEIMSESGIGPLDFEEYPAWLVVDTSEGCRIVARFAPDGVIAPRIPAWREAKKRNEESS